MFKDDALKELKETNSNFPIILLTPIFSKIEKEDYFTDFVGMLKKIAEINKDRQELPYLSSFLQSLNKYIEHFDSMPDIHILESILNQKDELTKFDKSNEELLKLTNSLNLIIKFYEGSQIKNLESSGHLKEKSETMSIDLKKIENLNTIHLYKIEPNKDRTRFIDEITSFAMLTRTSYGGKGGNNFDIAKLKNNLSYFPDNILKNYAELSSAIRHEVKKVQEIKAREPKSKLIKALSYFTKDQKALRAFKKIQLSDSKITKLAKDLEPMIKIKFENNLEKQETGNIDSKKIRTMNSRMPDAISAFVGTSFFTRDAKYEAKKKEAHLSDDAGIAAVNNDGTVVSMAIGDGKSMHNQTDIDPKYGYSRIAYFGSKKALEKASHHKFEKLNNDNLLQIVEEVSEEVKAKASVTQKNSYEARETKSLPPTASIAFCQSKITNGKLQVKGASVGDCMIAAYSPSKNEWFTIAPAHYDTNAPIPFTNPNIDKKRIITFDKALPQDSIILNMTNGVFEGLPWKDNNAGISHINKTGLNMINKLIPPVKELDPEKMKELFEDPKVESMLKKFDTDMKNINAEQLTEVIKQIVVNNVTESLKEPGITKTGDDMTMIAVSPQKVKENFANERKNAKNLTPSTTPNKPQSPRNSITLDK